MVAYKNGSSIVYYHSVDWNGLQGRQQYLMAEMARYYNVIYLDGGRDGAFKITLFQPLPGVTVIRGLVSILNALRRRRLNWLAGLLGRFVVSRHKKGKAKVVFWNTEVHDRPYRFIPHNYLIYDCIDPPFDRTQSVVESHYHSQEIILKEADIILATAETLQQECSRAGKPVYLINNACAPQDYDVAEESLVCPSWWPKTSLPVAAYLGSIDWRFDFEFASEAVKQNPQVFFVLAGNILPFWKDQVAELSKQPNVVFPGKISLEDGQYLLHKCNVGLICFTPGEMNDAINPVKLYAYTYLGKPIVGTAVRELLIRPDEVLTAETPAQFAALIPKAISLTQDSQYTEHLKKFAQANTWAHRAREAHQLIQEHCPG